MTGITLREAIGRLLAVLQETVEGGTDDTGYYLDSGPEFGLLGTLAGLDAATASRLSGGDSALYGGKGSGPAATSIAAHVHHTAVGLEAFAAYMQGDEAARFWEESWDVEAVDAPAWDALRYRLKDAYSLVMSAMENRADASTAAMGGAVGAIAHTAYHLGRIQEKLDNMG